MESQGENADNNAMHASYGSTETPTPVATPDGVQPDIVPQNYSMTDETLAPSGGRDTYKSQIYGDSH